jgi:hypothetical protein
MPTTDAGGRLIIISTARGAYNEFAKIYKGAKQKLNQFVPLFQPWNASRLITETEYEAKRREFAANPWDFYAEYPSDDAEAFRESGNPRFVNLPTFADPFPFRGTIVEDEDGLRFQISEDGPVWATDLVPDTEATYFVGADPAQGRGGDYSTAHVLSTDDDGRVRIHAFYQCNTVEPVEWAYDMDKLGRFFSGKDTAATLAVEDQGGQGQLPINELHRNLNYPRPYVYRPTGRRKHQRSDLLFSFPMSGDRRRMVIDKLADYLANANKETPTILGMNHHLLEELTQFVRQELPGGGVRYAADYGCHDDLVMSLAIALWALLENTDMTSAPVPDNGGEKTTRVNLRKMYEIRERNIRAAEEAVQEEWDSFILNGGYEF